MHDAKVPEKNPILTCKMKSHKIFDSKINFEYIFSMSFFSIIHSILKNSDKFLNFLKHTFLENFNVTKMQYF